MSFKRAALYNDATRRNTLCRLFHVQELEWIAYQFGTLFCSKFDCSAGLVFPDFDSENTPRIILCLNTIKHEAGTARAPFLAFSLCGLGFFSRILKT